MLLQEFIHYKPDLRLAVDNVNELGRLVESFLTKGMGNGDEKSYF